LTSITTYIEKKLGLKVNAEKSKVSKPTGIKFLGYGFWVAKCGKYKPKPHLKSIQKLKRKLKELTRRSWSISLYNRIQKLNYVVRGWVNYFRIANMKNVLERIDERLRTRVRVIIWKQWKRIKTRCDALCKLGMPFELAINCANFAEV
jgi:RNA-directed DNA polymerase